VLLSSPRQGGAAGRSARDPQGPGRISCSSRHGTYVSRAASRPRQPSRPPQRCGPVSGAPLALQCDRRGRQSRHDLAWPHRGGAALLDGSTTGHLSFPPGSTPPTSRSTSISRLASPDARLPSARAAAQCACSPRLPRDVAALVRPTTARRTLALSLSERRGARRTSASTAPDHIL